GKTDGRFNEAKSTTHTETSDDPWWELDLKVPQAIDRIVIWNRTDGNLQDRLDGFRIIVLDENRSPAWTQAVAKAPQKSAELGPSGVRTVAFAAALADYAQ